MKKFLNHWLLLGVITIGLASCGDDKEAPKVVADFTHSPTNVKKVTFTNASQNATSYLWDFGDGETSTDENPSHIYSDAGSAFVQLTATNAAGTSSTILKSLKVSDPCIKCGKNIIKDSTFTDESKWTKTIMNIKEPMPAIEFNSTTNQPTGSTTGLFISNTPSRAGSDVGENVALSTVIKLDAAMYYFTVDVKMDAGPAVIATEGEVGAPYHMFLEFYISPDAPITNVGFHDSYKVKDDGNNIHATRDELFGNGWDGPYKASNGSFALVATEPHANTSNGVGFIQITATGNYNIVIGVGKAGIKFGQWGSGSFGPNGIGISNLRLRKLSL